MIIEFDHKFEMFATLVKKKKTTHGAALLFKFAPWTMMFPSTNPHGNICILLVTDKPHGKYNLISEGTQKDSGFRQGPVMKTKL